MKRTTIVVLILIFAFNVALTNFLYGQNSTENTKAAAKSQDQAQVPTDAEQEDPYKNITKEEIVERLNTLLGYHVDIASNIPGIARTQAEDGTILITFNGTSLDQLDKETLIPILQQVNRLLNQKNLDNLQRQMKNLRQIDQINKTDRMMRDQRNLQQMQNFNRQQKQLRDLNKKY